MWDSELEWERWTGGIEEEGGLMGRGRASGSPFLWVGRGRKGEGGDGRRSRSSKKR